MVIIESDVEISFRGTFVFRQIIITMKPYNHPFFGAKFHKNVKNKYGKRTFSHIFLLWEN
jgi:hypothetical protein